MNTAGPTPNNEILQAFYDTAPIAIAVLGSLHGHDGAAAEFAIDFEILHFNPYAQRVTGLSGGCVSGKRCREVFPAAVVDSMLHRFAAVAATGATADFEQCWKIEGMRHWFHIMAVKQGDVLVVTAADISAQKMAELEAAAAQTVQTQQVTERYGLLFNSIGEAFALCEILSDARGRPTDYRLLEVNPAFEKMTGLPSQQAQGATLRQLLPTLEDRLWETYGRAAPAGEACRFEYRLEAQDRWFDVYAGPISEQSSGKFALVFSDITARKRAEEALERTNAELETRVQERTAELQQLSQARHELLQQLVTVQEDERRRIARELHDSLGQFLSALNLRMWMVEQTMDFGAEVMKDMRQLHQMVGEIERELDRLTMELRPPALDDFGLPEAIRRYAEEWSRTTGIPVDVYASIAQGERLEFTAETAVYRIVQEALTNVLKHAQASAVSIVLERQRADLRLIVEDDGVGFEPQVVRGGRRLGLVGIRERAALTGGWVDIESAPAAGTTLFVQIPVHKEEGA
jgi:PAS domain S-box-containing protein